MSKYADIISRLEAATGPNFELECEVRRICEQSADVLDKVPPAYTASLDAAIGLVERMLPGWAKGTDSGTKTNLSFVDPHDYEDRISGARHFAKANTPALALLIALFRALEALEAQS